MSGSGPRHRLPAKKDGAASVSWLRPLVVVLLVVLMALPGATAAPFLVSDPVSVAGSLRVPTERDQIQEGMLLFSGALDLTGDFEGPVVAMQSQATTRIDAGTLRVYDINDPLAISQLRPELEITGGSLHPQTGGSFYWSLPDATVTARSPHTFAFLFNIEANLPEMGFLVPEREGEIPPSLIAQAKSTPWRITGPGAERSVFLPIEGGFQVRSANGTIHPFDGNEWLVTIRGATEASLVADGIALPFEPGATATLTPSNGNTVFTPSDLQSFLDVATGLANGFTPPSGLPDEGSDPCVDAPQACHPDGRDPDGSSAEDDASGTGDPGDGNTTRDPAPPATTTSALTLPPAVATAIDTLGPFLQGSFFGAVSEPLQIGANDVADAGFTLVRFESLTLESQEGGTVAFSGSAPFVYSAGAVYHDAGTMRMGPLVISILSIVLYALAIAAWVAMRRWTLRPEDPALTERLRIPAIVTQWALLLFAFVLFDREIHYILGQSFLTSIGLYGGATLAAAPLALASTGGILLVQLLLWSAAAVTFGIPLALLGRSGLKAGGIGKPAYGFAIGLGALATWLLGTSLILALLDVVFGSVAGAIA